MKNLIVILGTTILGILIFNLMVGSDQNSILSISKNVLLNAIKMYGAN